MDNRDDLERRIIESFEKMSIEMKINYLAQVDKIDRGEEEPDNVATVTVRGRVMYDVARFGGPVYGDLELAEFLVSMAFVIFEITKGLLLKTKSEGELQIDDYRQILAYNDDLAAKVITETALYVVHLFGLELGDYLPDDAMWCTPFSLAKLFNAVKLSLHPGDDILIDTAIFDGP